MKHLVLSLVLGKPTESGNFYCYYSANDSKLETQASKNKNSVGGPTVR